MRAGRLRHQLAAQAPMRTNSVDGPVETWQTYATISADVQPATPRAVQEQVAGTLTSPVTHLVSTRYRSDIATTHRFLFRGRVLQIVSIQNVGERNRELVIACEERP